MTETQQDALSEAIDRALAATDAATDAAAEARAAARAVPTAAPAGGEKTGGVGRGLMLAAALGGAVSVLASGLVYLRAVSDLRATAEMQATATTVLIERIKALDALSEALAPETLARREDADRILAQMAELRPDPAPEPQAPPPAPADPGLAAQITQARTDIMGALADLGLRLDTIATGGAAAGPEAGELKMMLGETLRRLEALTPASGGGRAAPAPTRPRATPAPRPEPSPFQFP